MLKMILKILATTFLAVTILNAYNGVNFHNGVKETYYNKPMRRIVEKADTIYAVNNQYWEREDGAKMYGSFIIVAAPFDVYPYGSIIDTSLGKGIVLDTGTFAKINKNQIDIATTW